MVATLHAVGLHNVSIDIGHVGIFRSLVKNTDLDSEQENRLFDMLQRKSIPDLQIYLKQLPLSGRLSEQLCQLANDVGFISEASIIENNCMFITSTPRRAKPRRTSNDSMRSSEVTGT